MNTAYDDAHGTDSRNLDINDPLRARIARAVAQVRATTPLAQSLTNFVTINLVANAQLAVGGTAAMHYSGEEAAALDHGASKATYINMGTLLEPFRTEYPAAARNAAEHGLPWVLDPVGAGAGELRGDILRAFAATPPTIIRCNASEAIALAGIWHLDGADARARAGVEASDEVDEAIDAAHALARFTGGVVSVSGAVDLVTDGERDFRLPGGSVWMTKITGAGCSLGGVTATYACVADPLTAAMAAALHYNRAADSAERESNGPGSFQVAFLDALWNTTADEIAQSPIYVS
ncbi:hydroxyethylthiazole kinase [Bifidobacterium sp. SMB2]|uniref:Hydroxyethylthiazole kinase n=1 Tax=Bifidobacterium saimiriisciurei TaxID=2661627 RepID=A0ABX0C9F9_9BIFI|nr:MULTISPECIES: hydroxyethylthiazole kinase [Bifidobacterium]NEG95927.1 hydroxyethylthiazole kinase [Bifidobacterium sp. SMB2]NEH11774.1 hydroxyethylthiazole kinase [Bifidobacterium saimiriisciurei]